MTPDLEVLRGFPCTGFVPYETEYSRNFTPKHLPLMSTLDDIIEEDKSIADDRSDKTTEGSPEPDRNLSIIRRCLNSSMNLDLTSNTASEDENFSRYCKSTLRHYSRTDGGTEDARKLNSSIAFLIVKSYLNGNVDVSGGTVGKNNGAFVTVYMQDYKGTPPGS